MRSPLEKVLEILNEARDMFDPTESKIIKDINYCIKMISSNKLYEAELDIGENEEQEKSIKELGTGGRRKAVIHRDVVSWYNTFSA